MSSSRTTADTLAAEQRKDSGLSSCSILSALACARSAAISVIVTDIDKLLMYNVLVHNLFKINCILAVDNVNNWWLIDDETESIWRGDIFV